MILGIQVNAQDRASKEVVMPYVLIQVTREGVTLEQKAALIRGVTDLLVGVLNKNPAQTFVVIEEVETDNWGIAGMSVTEYRNQEQRKARHSGD